MACKRRLYKINFTKEYGGEGATIEDMVILQSYLGSIDGATALSIGWHLSVVGQLYEHEMWDKPLLENLQRILKMVHSSTAQSVKLKLAAQHEAVNLPLMQ